MVTASDLALDTGHEPNDSEHRELARLANELESADSAANDQLVGLLDEVIAHVQVDFAREEELMRQVSFPTNETRDMIGQHRDFSATTRLHVDECRRGERDASSVRRFVLRFLDDHEFGKDRPLTAWIRRKLTIEGSRELRFFTTNREIGGRVEIARLEWSEDIPMIAVSRPDLLNTDLVGKMLGAVARRTKLDTAHISWTTAD
jgi:hemerythrin-like metal-binding protein